MPALALPSPRFRAGDRVWRVGSGALYRIRGVAWLSHVSGAAVHGEVRLGEPRHIGEAGRG